MPFSRNGPGLKDWRGYRNFYERDEGRRHKNGRGRVHHDAQRTMIGIADFLVRMRNLRNGQQRQKNQTYNRNRRESLGPSGVLV